MFGALILLLPLLGLVFSGSDNDGSGDNPIDGADPPPDPPDPPPDTDTSTPFGRTGHFVADDLFGTNAVYTINTDDGLPTETFESAIDAFQLESFRFPAGEAEPNGGDGEDWLDVTQLTETGELRPELTNFMDNVEGGVTLVIPTSGPPVDEYGDGLAGWAEQVVNRYGDKIDAFEIGNEYWGGMGETEYGQKADIAVRALAAGIAAADEGDPDILVQMATPNAESEFHSSVDDRGYLPRLTDANNAIIDQLSDEARMQIDGVIEHYYWNDSPIPFQDNPQEVRFITRDYEVWRDRLGEDLDLYITEWNVKSADGERTGIQSMAILIEMVENMVEMDTETAHVWPINHNTTNDLGGGYTDGEVLTDDRGRVIETVRGAVFDLMSEALPGKELIRLDLEDVPDEFEIAAYEGDGEIVLYLGSQSLEPVNIAFDLRDIAPDFQSASAVRVGYDPATANGQSYVPGESIQPDRSVEIDGEPYYLTEHDVQALLTDFTFDSADIEVTLLPYQVLQMRIAS
jgi:hypothetical protein